MRQVISFQRAFTRSYPMTERVMVSRIVRLSLPNDDYRNYLRVRCIIWLDTGEALPCADSQEEISSKIEEAAMPYSIEALRAGFLQALRDNGIDFYAELEVIHRELTATAAVDS